MFGLEQERNDPPVTVRTVTCCFFFHLYVCAFINVCSLSSLSICLLCSSFRACQPVYSLSFLLSYSSSSALLLLLPLLLLLFLLLFVLVVHFFFFYDLIDLLFSVLFNKLVALLSHHLTQLRLHQLADSHWPLGSLLVA